MQKLLSRLKRLYFNGDKRTGSRGTFIYKELARRGCKPKKDGRGNIWVENGEGRPIVIFSSHMDIDPRISKKQLERRKNGGKKIVYGVLDNAVGCTLNMLLASKKPKKGTIIHIFTASEEVASNNPRVFARSAKEVVKAIKKRKIKPAFCVAIDVTYPKLKIAPEAINWDNDKEDIFYMMDKTHCYIDGYSNIASKRLARKIARLFADEKVKVRNLPGHDEAIVYKKIAPSFAFGPVVFGSFDQPEQSMPLSHAKTAFRFLQFIKEKVMVANKV